MGVWHTLIMTQCDSQICASRARDYFAAGFLPVKLLVELLNFSLVNDAAGKVTSALAMELDKRLKKSLLGDENYKLGDATKRTIADAIKNYTGKGWIRLMNSFPC